MTQHPVQRGNHDVGYQITFPGSNFIFHDSEGFEAGGVDEVEKVKDFIKERGVMDTLAKQLHVIWYKFLGGSHNLS